MAYKTNNMKTTEEILLDFDSDYFEGEVYGAFGYTYDIVQQAMIAYAEHVREEDRKIIAENVKIKEDYVEHFSFNHEKYDEQGLVYERLDRYGDVYGLDIVSLDKDSIINAPKKDLK